MVDSWLYVRQPETENPLQHNREDDRISGKVEMKPKERRYNNINAGMLTILGNTHLSQFSIMLFLN